MDGPTVRRHWLAAGAALTLSLACVGPTGRTFVTGRIEPRQIRFVTVRETTPGEAGGRRAACIHIRIARDNTGEAILCRFGIETPLHNHEGPVSTALAQRITADRINEATYSIFGAATVETPLGMLCESLKAALRPAFQASIAGGLFTTQCHEKTTPVLFGAYTL
ncbi:hypothetical protein D7Y13_23980 [Corallococcus praedator]|uniref:Lipoprotein n=1 Tax=Corallococcus praedator TaxID=2316724 RepID=A0ABX9QD56_9BACT|nr:MULTISPECIES: hypothetical protein [Corallococcus]RKH32928.1 hypothetical protein D7X75_13810 [Corallococcus sp. CA031C]RKI02663.1 hypothetical protein D7Y13_23980 [Corallococcus praedator]